MLVKLIIEREIGSYINIDDAGQSMLGVCATFDGNAQDFVRVLDDHHLEQFVVVVDHWSIDHLSFAAMGPPTPNRFICELIHFSFVQDLSKRGDDFGLNRRKCVRFFV